MKLTTHRLGRVYVPNPVFPGRQSRGYCIETWETVFTRKAWRWRLVSATAGERREDSLMARFPAFTNLTRKSPRGVVRWVHIRIIATAFAADPTIAALIDSMDRGEKTGPVLADAIQERGLPEQSDFLKILRSWS